MGCNPSSAGAQSAASSSSAPAEINAREIKILRLHHDESLTWGQLRLDGLVIRDSRCPLGARCISEGRASAEVDVSDGDAAPERIEIILRPTVEPAATQVGPYALRLLKLEPFPQMGVTRERAEVVATIEIRRNADASSK